MGFRLAWRGRNTPHEPVAGPPAAPKSPTGSIRHGSCPVRGGTATADAGRGASGRALPQRQRGLPNRWPSRAEPLLEAWKRGFSHAFQKAAQSRKHREGWGGHFSLLLVESHPVGQWELQPTSSPTNRRLMFRWLRRKAVRRRTRLSRARAGVWADVRGNAPRNRRCQAMQ